MNDHHFGYIIKLTKTNISDDVPTLFTITHLFYYPTFVGLWRAWTHEIIPT